MQAKLPDQSALILKERALYRVIRWFGVIALLLFTIQHPRAIGDTSIGGSAGLKVFEYVRRALTLAGVVYFGFPLLRRNRVTIDQQSITVVRPGKSSRCMLRDIRSITVRQRQARPGVRPGIEIGSNLPKEIFLDDIYDLSHSEILSLLVERSKLAGGDPVVTYNPITPPLSKKSAIKLFLALMVPLLLTFVVAVGLGLHFRSKP